MSLRGASAGSRNFRRLHCVNGVDGNKERVSAELFMRTRRLERAAQTVFFLGACAAFFGACVAFGEARGAGGTEPFRMAQTTVPQAPETPVSPANPSAFPGTTAPETGINGNNPLTGTPCLGSGSSAINGTTTPGATAPPVNGIYGQNRTTPGAC
jgi:hypothetical protein